MRPRIVDYLNETLGTQVFAWLVPGPAVIYPFAMLVVLVLYVRRSEKDALSRYHSLGSAIWAMVGGLIGARLLYVLLRIDDVVGDPAVLLDLGGSTMSWGAYSGGTLGFWLYLTMQRQPLLRYADVAGSVFGLGPFIGRLACFLNGDDYGRVAELPWAVAYPQGSYPFAAHVRHGLLDPSASLSLTVHPVQLYLAANALVLFLLFTWLWRRRILQPGVLFFLFWAAYGATRFSLEFFRGDVNRIFVGRFPDAQLLALLVCVCSLTAAASVRRRAGTSPRR